MATFRLALPVQAKLNEWALIVLKFMNSPRFFRLKIAVIVSLCSSLAAHDLPAQSGGGASRGGAANTVEGTGRGAGGPGDGQGPGQGAGQGLGPGGRNKDSTGGSSTQQQTGGRGANTGGAANTVEGTGRGAAGPGDGEGPGQGAGQGLGPGGRDKDRAEKDRSEREKQQRERDEKERADKARADRERQEKEKAEKERSQREREEKEKADRERTDREKEQREREEKDRLEREKKERAEREKADKERVEKERQEKERADRERQQKETADKEREEKERREKEQAVEERQQKEKAERERADREKEQREREEKDRVEREKQESEREEKQKEESDRPGTDQRDDDKRPGQPGEERKEEGTNDSGQTADQTKSGDETPRGEDERPRESLERSRDDEPLRRDPAGERLVPESPARDLVPRADNIPGAADAERALRSVTDPAAARDGFFGFLFGGRRAAAPAEEVSVSRGKGVVAAEGSSRDRRPRGAFLGMFRLEVPDLLSAAKVRRVEIDPRVTSPRTLTYKSRVSRVSRWIGPLTLGLLNYVPFETMNAAVSGRMNNLMAEEKISIEETAARVFAENLAEGKRFAIGSPPEAMVELEVTRYALDPVPTSIGRMKPTVSLTGRLYSPTGRLLWVGKGFSTIAERGIKGATVEQYEENPAALRSDFEEAVRVASRRLAMQANALPRAKVTVVPQQRE